MSLKKTLEAMVKERAPGPSPSFQVFHIIKAIELISHSAIGRGVLATKLGIGEGAARTLIDRLRDEGMLTVSKPGCALTRKGEKLWMDIEAVFPLKMQLERSKLTLSACNVAILVKQKIGTIRLGMEQRDAAFLAGAKGATTLVMRDGKLVMPSVDSDLREDVPEVYGKIVSQLKPQEGDVIVIGSADACDKAEYGAIAAALTLIDDAS